MAQWKVQCGEWRAGVGMGGLESLLGRSDKVKIVKIARAPLLIHQPAAATLSLVFPTEPIPGHQPHRDPIRRIRIQRQPVSPATHAYTSRSARSDLDRGNRPSLPSGARSPSPRTTSRSISIAGRNPAGTRRHCRGFGTASSSSLVRGRHCPDPVLADRIHPSSPFLVLPVPQVAPLLLFSGHGASASSAIRDAQGPILAPSSDLDSEPSPAPCQAIVVFLVVKCPRCRPGPRRPPLLLLPEEDERFARQPLLTRTHVGRCLPKAQRAPASPDPALVAALTMHLASVGCVLLPGPAAPPHRLAQIRPLRSPTTASPK
ncbi:uncharacterized protein [Triticum aestivum]|uniref:uncharacterized protein n=1 Tax=Triticum aestivum TaxID=4565 RepID=UPI001D01BBD6|nr:uncharacterized protein LOC123191737 [Triticum aestivum]